MGVHWDSAFTRWWPHKEGEKVFSLEHLHPFVFMVEVPAKSPYPERTAHIRVGFSMHCFTRRWIKDGHALDGTKPKRPP